MKEKLAEKIKQALTDLGIEPGAIVLEHPGELAHGDYSTSAALAYAKAAQTNPRALAEKIVAELAKNPIAEVEKIEIAGPGFINFHLTQKFFADAIAAIESTKDTWGRADLSNGKKVMVEYTDPNPFKPFHIGHLMTNAIGESTARIFEYAGANVIRANYQGDVGLHVAKSIWALLKSGKGDTSLPAEAQAQYIGRCYTDASTAYEENPDAKAEIDAINKKVYDRSDASINDLYDWGRAVTLEAFETIYKNLGTKFVHYFLESEMAPLGAKIVRENTGKVFEESDGAIVFKAEEYNPKLHTRVFITKQGLPTYETKEIGLTTVKFEKENPDLSIVVTAIEQGPYMEVVQKAISLIHPDLESRMKHLTHGMMRFANGKMSSRKGNVITGESLMNDAKDLVMERIKDREFSDAEREALALQVAVAAIKYTILKQQFGGNIIYDEEKSVSFDGDSGPYLQYTTVRANSILTKGKTEGVAPNATIPEGWTTTALEKYLYRFQEVVEHAYEALEPHHVAGFLLEIAAVFNSFYAQEQIVNKDDAASAYKLALTEAFVATMKNGLYLLGIEVPVKM
jgi:arginyl-tRNA synthetase